MTRGQLDRLLEHALLIDDHGALAKQLDTLAQVYESGEVSRAEILVRAAEEWRQAGRPDLALERFQRATDDGGEVLVDPRSGIADALFELERHEEARDVIETVRATEWNPATALTIAETLLAYGDLPAAHDWATDGLAACGASLQDAHVGAQSHVDAHTQAGYHAQIGAQPYDPATRDALLRTRYRIRVDLGLPEDALDALLDVSR